MGSSWASLGCPLSLSTNSCNCCCRQTQRCGAVVLVLQEAKELLEKFVIGSVKAGAAKPKQAPPVSVTDLGAAAAADPSKPKVCPLPGC